MKVQLHRSVIIATFNVLVLAPLVAATRAADAPIATQDYKAAIRVACVGDSITAGSGTASPAFQAYPKQLGRLLDERWQVSNFGVSGTTLLNAGDHPYQKTEAFQKALALQPDVVVIMLGTNDTKPQNWRLKDQFVADYQDLIGKFRALPSKPRIFICHPVPVPGTGNFGINEAGVQEEIPLLDTLADREHLGVIDIHGAFAGKDVLIPDRVHPNAEGAALLAKTVFNALTGKVFDGPVPAMVRSQWQGYQRLDFLVADRPCLLVIPKTPAPGNPWIWRTEFFGAFPAADEALLGKGYHVAYMNVENMYGAPVAMALMNQYYAHLTTTCQLSRKVVVEGFSRGGLFAFNWAALNPAKVACLYVDAPVCDFKSWPGGKGKGKGSPANWEGCLKVYGLTEEQALAYQLNPVDNLKPLAAAKIPVIAVCGDADDVVPIAENIQVVEKRYRELGGEIKVIVKPGVGHHPHSLADPQPIVDFILAH
ncbi:MAG: GDSL-type esterase/lipase family protein [Verrucomicrobiota bacterium]